MNEETKSLLTQELAKFPEIIFSILYGSAVDSPNFRDIDIAIYIEHNTTPECEEWKYAFSVTETLEKIVPFPVDVRVINKASLPFRYNVSKGTPLHLSDPIAWADFKERAWIEYLDFQPTAMRYLKDMA